MLTTSTLLMSILMKATAAARDAILSRRHKDNHHPQQQSRRRLRNELESLSWLRARLHLLLCATDSRISRLFGRARFREQNHGENKCAGIVARELERPGWKPQALVMSGVTDPYQPVEKKLRITRGCLEVLAKFRNPVAIITKNRLVTRDADLLRELANDNAAAVNISVTSLDPELQRVLEPRTSSPEARLDTISQLRAAGIPVGVMVAPVIPGLTDHEVPKILEACANAGAQFAGYTIVRLPWAVAPLFEHWLEEHFPDRKEKVLGRIRLLRGDRLNNSQWHTRMTGEGIFAEQIASLFEVGCRRAGIGERPSSRPTALGARESN